MSHPFGIVHVRLARAGAVLKDAAEGRGENIHEQVRRVVHAALTREQERASQANFAQE
jgi:hypothetical protein